MKGSNANLKITEKTVLQKIVLLAKEQYFKMLFLLLKEEHISVYSTIVLIII